MTTREHPPATPDLASDLVARWVEFYRGAHAAPELSDRETATTVLIEDALDDLGIEHFRVSATGTVGILRNGDGPVVAFRADIDGLPVREATDLEYRSTAVDGDTPVMHACGHDTHFSSLLGAADHLVRTREDWSGTVVLLFQPAEETANGSKEMVEGGVWDRAPRPEIVLGQHVTRLPGHTARVGAGDFMSLANSLRVTVHGTQAHGSQPDASVDPIVTAAAMILRLQTIVSRELPPATTAVVTVGTIHGGTATNIIPESVEFTLNLRTPNEEIQRRVLEAVDRILTAEATAARASVTVDEINAFPRCFNDPDHTDRVAAALRSVLGDDAVDETTAPFTGSEDVGTFADAIGVPLVYWVFGGFPRSAFADGALPAVNHSPEFAPDADLAISTGVACAVAALRTYLAAGRAS